MVSRRREAQSCLAGTSSGRWALRFAYLLPPLFQFREGEWLLRVTQLQGAELGQSPGVLHGWSRVLSP